MNIFCNASGTIFHVDTEPIHQGSLGVNKIRLIGQFPSYSQVLMAFTLPDGTVTKPRYLAKAGELDEIKVENGTSFTVWEGLIGATPKIKITGEGDTLKAEPVKDSNEKIVYDLDYAITEYYGDVDVQFFVYSAGVSVDVDGVPVNNGYGCLATQKARFTIQKGVPMQMDASDLNYDEPKALLSQILAVVANTQELYQHLENNKLDKTGGTMTGDLLMDECNVVVTSHGEEAKYGNYAIDYNGPHGNAVLEFPQKSGTLVVKDKNNMVDVGFGAEAGDIAYTDEGIWIGDDTVCRIPNKSGTLALQEDVDASIGTINASLSEAKGRISSNTSKLLQVEQIAKGAQQAISFDSYEEMVNALNSADNSKYKVGQSIYIKTLNVPDVWITSIGYNPFPYTYTSDEEIVNKLKNGLSLEIGYYYIAQLETGKVPLENYLPLTGGKVTGQLIVKGEDGLFFKNETTISGDTITLDGVGKVTIGTFALSKTISGTDNMFLYPEKSGTLALLEDLDGLVAEADALSQDISVINLTLEQSGLLKKYKQPITQEYSERVTADGLNVLDGSRAILKKVVGNTVACKNLVDIEKIYASMVDGDVTLEVNFTQNIFVSAGELATVPASVWRFSCTRNDGTIDYVTDGNLANGGKKVTATADNPIVKIVYRGTNITAGQYSKIMIAYGDTATEYQPYFTGLKSASFGGIESTNADGTETSTLDFPKTETPLGTTIDFESKKITEEYAQYTFNGTERVVSNGAYGDGYHRYSLTVPTMMKSGVAQNGICDKYPTDKAGWNDATNECIRFGQSNGAMYLILSSDLTVEEVQALIAGMTVRYPVETPTETDFTAEQSASGNEYTAYKGGTEKALHNDGNEYGADNTLTQDYILVTEVK